MGFIFLASRVKKSEVEIVGPLIKKKKGRLEWDSLNGGCPTSSAHSFSIPNVCDQGLQMFKVRNSCEIKG